MRTYGTITYKQDKWVLDNIAPHVAIRLKHVFPSIPVTGTCPFTLRNTPDMCSDILWFIDRYPLEVSPADRKRLNSAKKTYLLHMARSEELLMPDYVPREVTLNEGEKARDYQLSGKDFYMHVKRTLCGDDLGLGKTLTAMLSFLEPCTIPAAVVMQSHMPKQWDKQVKRFTNLRVHIVKTATAYNLPEADVYLFKYTSLKGWVDLFDTRYFKSAIFDEIQEVRCEGSMKHLSCYKLSLNTDYSLGLSATPIYNYGGEIYNIMQICNPGCLGKREDFYREWCTPIGSGKYKLDNPDAFGTYLRDNSLMFRRTRKDVGRELPPVNRIVLDVEYDEQIADDAEELAKQLAIRVVSSSFHDSGEAAREFNNYLRHATGVSNAKSVAMYVKLLLDQDIPVVLAGWHRDVYEIWLKELAHYKPVMFTGTESPTQKEKAKDMFVNGETNLFIISLRSGIGLDGLQFRSKYIVVGELDWSPKVHEQLIGRIDRDGQEEQVTAIFLVSDFGSDPVIVDILSLKADQTRGIEDPMAGIQQVHSDTTAIKQLAADFLSKRNIPIPVREPQLETQKP